MTKREFERKYDFLRYRPQTQADIDRKRELYDLANDELLPYNGHFRRALGLRPLTAASQRRVDALAAAKKKGWR